ncbi:MAG: hypothetical protein IRZ05_12995 [Micromonosporaceae bacterium]|nr:hypothetical protein [Micromonosporaceae bacterium]
MPSLRLLTTGGLGPLASDPPLDDRRPQFTGEGVLCLIAIALVVLLALMVRDWRRGRRR